MARTPTRTMDRVAALVDRILKGAMHAGFTRLRSFCPMNIEAPLQHLGPFVQVSRSPAQHSALRRTAGPVQRG